jgi:hypothetical protein
MGAGGASREVAGGRYVILLIDPDTGGIEVYGPLDDDEVVAEAARLRELLDGPEGPAEVGLLVAPLQAPGTRGARAENDDDGSHWMGPDTRRWAAGGS